jgi:multiple sugar transport system substrate-binding protein
LGRRRGLTRRRFLKAGGGALAGAYLLGLAGCGGREGDGGSEGGSGPIKVPDTGSKLPEGDVTFRLIDSGDRKALFWEEFFPAYQEKHPNITMEYDGLPWEEIAEVVPLGIRNGSAHDVFAIPLNVTGAQAVRQEWVAPLDDIVPDFESWKAGLPEGTLYEGVHMFDGKTYTIPLTSNKRHGNMILYDRQLLEKAGYDPSAEPLTWKDYRQAAKKITEQGEGQAYGVIFAGGQTPTLEAYIATLAHAAGAPAVGSSAGYLNLKTGEYAYDADEYVAAIELMMSLKSDGSVFPGSASLIAPEARARMPQGVVGMILQGPWNIPEWQEDSPDWEFGVASHPLPDSGEPIPVGYSPANLDNALWLYSKSKLGAVAGEIFSYVGSLEGQKAWATITGGVGDPPLFEEAWSAADDNPQANKAFELAEQMVLTPDPVVRNPDIGQVYLEMRTITPNFGEAIQSIFVGETEDIEGAMRDLKDRSEQELERSIEAARQKGAEVSRDDWVFPNWNPREDYTPDKYDEL